MGFSHLRNRAQYFRDHPEYCRTREGLVDLVCRDCDFWKEDERDYECGARALLQRLLEKDVLSIEEIISAVAE